MLRRLLPAALLVVVACAVALAVALRGEEAVERGAGAAPLARIGDGPAGSAVVTLRDWRYRADPDDRGRDHGWARGAWRGTPVELPYSPNARQVSGAAGPRSYAGSVGWFARGIDAPVG